MTCLWYSNLLFCPINLASIPYWSSLQISSDPLYRRLVSFTILLLSLIYAQYLRWWPQTAIMPLILLEWLMAPDKRKVSGFLGETFSIWQDKKIEDHAGDKEYFEMFDHVELISCFIINRQEIPGLKCRSWKMIASKDKSGKAQKELDVKNLVFSHKPRLLLREITRVKTSATLVAWMAWST